MEQIDIRQFAARMKIGVTTARQWLRDGVLVEGQDYLRRRRIIRILWDDELPRRIASAEAQRTKRSPTRLSQNYAPKINWSITKKGRGRNRA